MMKKVIDELREAYLSNVIAHFTNEDEQVLRTGTNEIAIPCVDGEGNEQFVVITVKVPKGSHDGDLYDGYSIAEDYEIHQREKAEKAATREAAKQKKIAADKKARAEKRTQEKA